MADVQDKLSLTTPAGREPLTLQRLALALGILALPAALLTLFACEVICVYLRSSASSAFEFMER